MAATLQDAAHTTYARTRARWLANTLATNTQAFIDAVSPFFPDQIQNNRPIGNWIALLQATINTTSSSSPLPLPLWNQYVEQIYRLCLAADAAQTAGLITAPQAAGVLAAWNASIGP